MIIQEEMWWEENKIISMLQAFFYTVIGIVLFIPITIALWWVSRRNKL